VRNLWGDVEGMWIDLMAQKGFVFSRSIIAARTIAGHALRRQVDPIWAKWNEDPGDGVNNLKSPPYVGTDREWDLGLEYGGYDESTRCSRLRTCSKRSGGGGHVSDWRRTTPFTAAQNGEINKETYHQLVFT